MTRMFSANTVLQKGLVGAMLIGAAVALAPAAALAGSCPAGKQGVDVRKPDTTPARDVTDTAGQSLEGRASLNVNYCEEIMITKSPFYQ
jgi:hypothetical protein